MLKTSEMASMYVKQEATHIKGFYIDYIALYGTWRGLCLSRLHFPCIGSAILILRSSYVKAVDEIRCLRCETDLSANTAFYTIARNGRMFGFFCSQGCAQESEHQKYLKAYVLRIAQPPSTHKDLAFVPDVKVLKQYEEELAKRRIWKKYFS